LAFVLLHKKQTNIKAYIMKKNGFTLIELLVAFVILGIVTAIAIPGFARWYPRYRLKSASRELYANLQLARLEAVKRNGNCSITYSTAPDQYTFDCIAKTVTLSDYGSGVCFQGPGGETFATATITFNSRGLSNQGYAYLSNQDNTAFYRIGPLSSGVIRFHQWTGAAWE
jgi:prepilin-type N-terminal cleavage/methylation domain-containing protein